MLTPESVTIQKIKKLRYGWRVEYLTRGVSGVPDTKHIFPESKEDVPGNPTLEFDRAVKAFVSHAIAHGMLAEEWKDWGEVTGIRFKRENGGVGVAISITAKPDDYPAINVNTPYHNPNLCIYAQKDIQNLLKEVVGYLNGERLEQQLELKLVG